MKKNMFFTCETFFYWCPFAFSESGEEEHVKTCFRARKQIDRKCFENT
jgi:hypothetical protein